MVDFRLTRPPQTDDELYWLVKAVTGVTIPRHTVCPEHQSPFQAFSDAFFRRNSIDPSSPVKSLALWHGSRGLSGKSYMLSVLGQIIAMFKGSDVNLLGGSMNQSANIHQHMRSVMEHENFPRYMITDEGNQLIKFSNRAKIRPLTASQKTVRGPHPATLLLDEIDEMEIAILDASLGQPMPQKNWLGEIVMPYTVMCSTWQNPVGTFTEIYRRAEERGIPKYTWCYKDTANPIDGWLSQEAIEEKKASIPKEMWRVEYELGEPSIGNRAFDADAVEELFSLPFEPLERQEARDYEEYTFALPERDGIYVAGADWAKEQDYTVISVMRVDRAPGQLCYYARFNRRPYPFMIGKYNEAIARYNAAGEHDRTGLGNVVEDYLDMRAHGFTMSGEKRAAMLSEYVSAVEKVGTYRFPKIPSAYVATKYAQVGDLYSNSKEYHLPDEVCSMALAHYRAIRHPGFGLPITLKSTGEPNRYAKVLDHPETEAPPPVLRDGEVRRVTSEEAFSLLV